MESSLVPEIQETGMTSETVNENEFSDGELEDTGSSATIETSESTQVEVIEGSSTATREPTTSESCQGRFKIVGLWRLGIVGKRRFRSPYFCRFS